MMRYLGVLEGQKLSFSVEKQGLGLIFFFVCLGFFYFCWKYWACITWIFNSKNCECLSFCKLGLYQDLNFDSADIAFTLMLILQNSPSPVREEPSPSSTAFLIQLEGERSVWAWCLYRLLALPGHLIASVKLGASLPRVRFSPQFLSDLQWWI